MKKLPFEVSDIKVTYKTRDYDLFEHLEFNRETKRPHINLLAKSISRHGFIGVAQVIQTSLIDGVSRFYILDGQHRIAAARSLNEPFAFQVTEINDKDKIIDFISTLNNSGKGWSTNQFLKVQTKGKGTYEYVKLEKVMKDTGFQISPLIEAYTFSGGMVDFRNGTLKFPNETKSDILIEQLKDLNKYLPQKAFCRRTILRLMQQEKYNHKKMKVIVKNLYGMMGKDAFPENEKDLRDKFQLLIDRSCDKK